MFDARNPEGELAVPREIAIEVCQKEFFKSLKILLYKIPSLRIQIYRKSNLL